VPTIEFIGGPLCGHREEIHTPPTVYWTDTLNGLRYRIERLTNDGKPLPRVTPGGHRAEPVYYYLFEGHRQ